MKQHDRGCLWMCAGVFAAFMNSCGSEAIDGEEVGEPLAEGLLASGNTGQTISINSGGAATGSFLADQGFSGGSTYSTSARITTTRVGNVAPAAAYQSERYGTFTYTIGNLTARGAFTVRLHFAEIYFTAAGQRAFNVSINGTRVLTNFDIFAAAGAKRAVVKEFAATANASGQIVIAYTQGTANNAKSSGIEIVSRAVALPAAPVASFTASPSSGTAPLAVQFTDTSTGSPTSWSWTFGDGATSPSQSPSHIYSEAGTFTAQLTASNDGGSSSKTVSITVSAVAAKRDWRKQPFASTSPWNYPVGSGAVYTSVPNLTSVYFGLGPATSWTAGIYVATSSDRVGSLYFNNSNWSFLYSGITINGTHYPVHNSGNPAVVENWLRQNSSTTNNWPANNYVTVVPGASSPNWPADYHHATDPYYSRTFNIPNGAVPSPDTDGHLAVYQPNGWVLETYASIVLANGDVVTSVGSYTDAQGDGTGWSSGRRASMLPSFAGLIRSGEITAGSIPHAMNVLLSATMLKEQAMWPAYSWDTNAGYSGTLPMGSLLAIPASVDVHNLGLTAQGEVVAHAAQDYGIYVADRGGPGGMTLLAELNASDSTWSGQGNDLSIIKNNLKWLSNNSASTPGGGGTPRQPLAAPLSP
jgi:PKD repeat protein